MCACVSLSLSLSLSYIYIYLSLSLSIRSLSLSLSLFSLSLFLLSILSLSLSLSLFTFSLSLSLSLYLPSLLGLTPTPPKKKDVLLLWYDSLEFGPTFVRFCRGWWTKLCGQKFVDIWASPSIVHHKHGSICFVYEERRSHERKEHLGSLPTETQLPGIPEKYFVGPLGNTKMIDVRQVVHLEEQGKPLRPPPQQKVEPLKTLSWCFLWLKLALLAIPSQQSTYEVPTSDSERLMLICAQVILQDAGQTVWRSNATDPGNLVHGSGSERLVSTIGAEIVSELIRFMPDVCSCAGDKIQFREETVSAMRGSPPIFPQISLCAAQLNKIGLYTNAGSPKAALQSNQTACTSHLRHVNPMQAGTPASAHS